MKTYYVYILASCRDGTLYVGITSDLIRRIYQHKTQQIKGFTSRYNITKLVYFVAFSEVTLAIKKGFADSTN